MDADEVLNRKTFSARRRALFLDVLESSCCVRTAATAAGVSFRVPYDHRKKDPAFAAAWRAALSGGFDAIIARLRVAAGAVQDAAAENFDPKLALEIAKTLLQRDMMELRGPRAPRGQVTRASQADTDAAILKGLAALAKRKAR